VNFYILTFRLQMKNQKWIYNFFKIFLGFLLIITIINYSVDPFQQYRVSDWYKITDKKQRDVTPGLAKNFTYKTAVIGSSMTENFLTSNINEELNTTSLKLSMAGMTAHEMHQILNVVLKNNSDIKQIILALDLYAFAGNKKRTRNKKLPLYLYDDNIINDIHYLLNKETLEYSIKILKNKKEQSIDMDHIWYWGDAYEFSEKSVLNAYLLKNFNSSFQAKDFKSKIFVDSFNFNILPFIHNNPDVTFLVFYPPYSYLAYKGMKKQKWLNEIFSFKRYLSSLNLSNLQIYDFQCESLITEDLNNYKDISHYSPEINKYIISSIKEKKHLITPKNIEQCLNIIQNSADKDFHLDIGDKYAL